MKPSHTLIVFAAAWLAAGCSTAPSQAPTTSAAEVGEIRAGTGYLKGYLAPSELPDSLALLPPPPLEGSPAMALDVATFRSLTALRNTPRGALATQDANLRFPQAAETFACALGVRVSEEGTPHLNMLLRRTLADAGGATYKAKNKYQRTRPFVALGASSCTPKEEAFLAKDGSYPSGHSAAGWAWALVLSEVAPERADALLQRGRAFSQSRGICGVHWQSDIEAGRLMGAAAVSRLHANPTFVAQVAAAKAEVAKARASQEAAMPSAQCAAEKAAIESSAALQP